MSTKKKAPKGTSKITAAGAPKKGKGKTPKEGKTYPANTALTVTAPSAVSTILRKARSNPVRIVMTEEVSDVVCQKDFENSALIINPGNEELFPWGSTVAQNFTSFKFNKLNFRYVSSTDSTTSGTVAMAVQADPEKPAFQTEKQILNHEGSVTSGPWTSTAIDGLSKSTKTLGDGSKFIEDVTGESITGFFDTLQTVATGVLNVATLGLAIAGAVDQKGVDPEPKVTGKLLVDYDVTLWDPDSDAVLPDEGISLFQASDTGSSYSGNGYLNVIEPFPGETQENPLRISVETSGTSPAVNEFHFTEAGRYQIQFDVGLNGDTVDRSSSILLDVWGVGCSFVYENGVIYRVVDDPDNRTYYKASCYVDVTDALNGGVVVQFASGAISDGILSDATHIAFGRVKDVPTLDTLYKMLPKGKRGCLPDCKRSSAVSYLKDEHHSMRVTQAANEVLLLTDKLRRKGSLKEKFWSKTKGSSGLAAVDCKSAVPPRPKIATSTPEDYFVVNASSSGGPLTKALVTPKLSQQNDPKSGPARSKSCAS